MFSCVLVCCRNVDMVNSAGFPRKKGAQLYDFATIVRICFEVFGVDMWVQLLKFGEILSMFCSSVDGGSNIYL